MTETRLKRSLTTINLMLYFTLRQCWPMIAKELRISGLLMSMDRKSLWMRELGFAPTKTNEEMLLRAYEFYHQNRKAIERRTNVSAHNGCADMGVIRLLKWLS